MPKFKAATIFFLLIFSFSLFAQTPSKPGTSGISGRVLLGGEPAAGVSVGLQPQQPNSGPFVTDRGKYQRTQTDGEGRFQFTALSAGQYRVLALTPGFPAVSESSNTIGRILNLAEGENIERVEIKLERGAVITGRLTDAAGNPMVEKNIRLSKQDARGNFVPYYVSGSSETMTDDRGVYRIHSLPAGKYKVSFGNPPSEGAGGLVTRLFYPLTFHPATTDEAQAKIVDLSQGAEAADVDIKLGEALKTYDVAGRVVDAATGKPIAGIRVGHALTDASGRVMNSGTTQATTDPQGDFKLQGVMPGRYAAFADTRFDQQSDFYSDLALFEISNDDIGGVEVKVHRGGSISGTALVENSNDPAIIGQLSKVTLNLLPRTAHGFISSRSARLSANGTFRFAGLKPGKVDLRTFSPPQGLKLLRIEHNGAPVQDGLELQAGEHLSNVRVVFGYGTATVRGQVKFIGGALPPGANVSLSVKPTGGAASSDFTAPVDARNQFVLQSMTAGEYDLRLFLYGISRTPETAKLFESVNRASHRVTVAAAGETQTEFVVDLSRKENQ